MRTILLSGLAALALTVAWSGTAEAKFTAANRSGKPVWVTLYNNLGSQLDSFCLSNTHDKVWEGGNVLSAKIGSPGEMLYLRGELKGGTDCGGKTLSDTGRGGTIMVGKDTVKTFVSTGGRLRVS